MKKGLSRIIVGILFIIIQMLGLTGTAKAGVEVQLSFESLSLFAYTLMYLVGYYFVGILGAVFLISGIIARNKSKSTN